MNGVFDSPGLALIYAAAKDAQQLPDKPLYGDPCNGCGMCCVAEQCPLSVIIFGQHGLCPAIQIEQGRIGCGLIQSPADLFDDDIAPDIAEMAGLLLGSGNGCDMTANDADDARYDQLQDKNDESARNAAASVTVILNRLQAKLGGL